MAKRITLSIHLNETKDRDIIAFLEGVEDGERCQLVRRLLRTAIPKQHSTEGIRPREETERILRDLAIPANLLRQLRIGDDTTELRYVDDE